MTAQIHELLILNGEETSMTSCPRLPRGRPRIVETQSDDAERKEANVWVFSTACWRQYLGSWEITDDRLYLIRLEGRYKLVGKEPLFADWFTGELRIPRGKKLLYVHVDFETVFEQELRIEIERGLVVNSRVIDNRGKEWIQKALGVESLSGIEDCPGVSRGSKVSGSSDEIVCEICGRPGDHPECRKKGERFDAKRRLLLRQFAIDGRFGPVSSDPEMTLEQAVSRLKEHLGYEPRFDGSWVIENRDWWFIPYGWIGVLGFVVDKHTGGITGLGSGLGAVSDALKAYQSGLIDPDPPGSKPKTQ